MIHRTMIEQIETDTLNIGYVRSGPNSEKIAMLLHGWPDDINTWEKIVPALHSNGWQTIVPYLRGFGSTRFLSEKTFKTGQLCALGQDVLDLADALELEKFAIIGHDWGARAAYIASCVAAERISHCVALSVGWGTNDPDQVLSLKQAQNYWYHWYMALDRGKALVHDDWYKFTRYIWNIWNPAWKISDAEFEVTARAFNNPDWAEIVLHSYRVRWGLAPVDPTFDALEERLRSDPGISVPTLVIHGGGDPCNDPVTSEGKEKFFTDSYNRIVIDGVGHFPQRESPEAVINALLPFLSK